MSLIVEKKSSHYKKILLPVTIIIATVILMMIIFKNPPTSNRAKPSKAPQMTVEITTLAPKTYQVMVQSFGTVKPRTQSVLFAQVSGQINYVSTVSYTHLTLPTTPYV